MLPSCLTVSDDSAELQRPGTRSLVKGKAWGRTIRRVVLDCATEAFVSGEFVAVLSKSGGGKSTVLNLIAFAFNELNLHRIQVTVFSYNERSISLVEKLGFQREGVYREFLQRDGRRHDMVLYGLLRHEWKP